jgi:hypothetical protein
MTRSADGDARNKTGTSPASSPSSCNAVGDADRQLKLAN